MGYHGLATKQKAGAAKQMEQIWLSAVTSNKIENSILKNIFFYCKKLFSIVFIFWEGKISFCFKIVLSMSSQKDPSSWQI